MSGGPPAHRGWRIAATVLQGLLWLGLAGIAWMWNLSERLAAGPYRQALELVRLGLVGVVPLLLAATAGLWMRRPLAWWISLSALPLYPLAPWLILADHFLAEPPRGSLHGGEAFVIFCVPFGVAALAQGMLLTFARRELRGPGPSGA